MSNDVRLTSEQLFDLTQVIASYVSAIVMAEAKSGAKLEAIVLNVESLIAQERERCAKVCETPKPECCGSFVSDDNSYGPICCGKYEPGEYMDGPECAAAIRGPERAG